MHSRPGHTSALPAAPLWTPPTRNPTDCADAEWLEPARPGENLFTLEEWQVLGRAFDFSARELAVAILLVEGLTREEIGARLRKADGSGLSGETVRVYMERVLLKVRAEDRLGLALRLLRAYRACHQQFRR